MPSLIVGVQFGPVGKQYHFDAQGIADLQPGDRVVVRTSRGKQLGIITGYVPKEQLDSRSYKPIERRASPQDLVQQQQWDAKAHSALVACVDKAQELGLTDYKFVRAEYNFDGSQVTIFYTTERKRSDVRALHRELRRALRTQVDLFQVGPRDLAKMLDGLGACGEQRCCARFLTKFNSVSIRMAKVQNISLTPSEITGVCGRLRCCLAYEFDQYSEAAEGLPRRGKDVVTPYGRGRVVEVRTLAGEIVVDVEGARHTVLREDIGKKEFTTPPTKDVPWPSWLPEKAGQDEPEEAERPAREQPRAKPKQDRKRDRRAPRSQQPPGKGTDDRPAAPKEPKPQKSGRKPSRRRRRSNPRGRQDAQE